MNPEIQKYINEQRKIGTADTEIVSQLKASGWREADINEGVTGSVQTEKNSWFFILSPLALIAVWVLSFFFSFGCAFSSGKGLELILCSSASIIFVFAPLVSGFWLLRIRSKIKNSGPRFIYRSYLPLAVIMFIFSAYFILSRLFAVVMQTI